MSDMPHYLQGLSWPMISREERFFCAELYFTLSRMPTLAPFISWLNGSVLPNEAQTPFCMPMDAHWNVGFEVCFYRDYIHRFKYEGTSSIRDKKVPGTEEAFMIKRTFDLALFHPEHLVIIEAKAKEGLSHDQTSTFLRDKNHLSALLGLHASQVHLVLLCTDHYSQAKRTRTPRTRFDGMITWKALAERAPEWGADEHTIQALARADSLMGVRS